ncbi:type II secretion system protein [Candidatus Azambacteria bacterium]|nr:type II secretion system protein [Candidatus Azambacteria bacterium]MBI3684926.1 type II secretion system protein [Candidatus Azambacteria bacterium]
MISMQPPRVSQRKTSRGRSGQGALCPRPLVQSAGRSSGGLACLRNGEVLATLRALYQNHPARLLRRFHKRTGTEGERRLTPSIDFLAGKINASFRGKLSAVVKSRGFTLIETLVYVALVSIVGGALTLFLINNMHAYSKVEARQNVFNNVNDVLKLIADEVKYATGIYTPTSAFDSDSGQLSLETALNAPAGENTTYVDFYIDNGRIYEKREGQSSSALTSERVFVERLRFGQKTATTTLDSISTDVQARINTASVKSEDQARVALTSSASLRGAY